MARSLREAARPYRGRAAAESGRRGHLREPEETSAGGVAATEVSPVFRLEGVTKRFGGVVAVEDVAFDLQPGEVHALVGENGAGKSTLMKIVDGLYGPDEGTLEVGGEAASFSSPREAEASGIAMIPQELDLFPELSVGLDATSAVKRLSVAEQQIVAIARALVGEAQAVIMDEPTSSLTERETRQLFGIIEDLTAEGVGVVYISHRLEEIFEISDRIT